MSKRLKIKLESQPESNLSTIKTFNYKIDDITLNFNLTVDKSGNLEKFKTLLELAVKDITETINAIK